jgi:hypothetical protein
MQDFEVFIVVMVHIVVVWVMSVWSSRWVQQVGRNTASIIRVKVYTDGGGSVFPPKHWYSPM